MSWGLITLKERWGLSWRGWLIVLVAILLAFYLCLFQIYPFLATTHRVNGNALVVEGWIHDYAIRAALKEFRSNRYDKIFTTGGPIERNGGYVNDYQTSASVGADLLKKYGVPDSSVQMVPSRVMDRDRTWRDFSDDFARMSRHRQASCRKMSISLHAMFARHACDKRSSTLPAS